MYPLFDYLFLFPFIG